MDGDLLLALRVRGTDVATALEAGMIRLEDADHLEFATSQGRALYSFNIGDYCFLHTEYLNQNKHHAGIILASQQQYSVGEQMRRLSRIIGAVSAEEIRDSIVFLSAWGQ
ncbi:MAG: DUF5615 family PIN-like protein [Blastocatellia bacterium]|nr:DUF5615 family PIN-like protein [Blastocatellia bacterium]